LSLIDPPSYGAAAAFSEPLPGWVDVEIPLAWDDAALTLSGRTPTADCPFAIVGAWRLEWETGTVQQSTTQFVVVRRATNLVIGGPLPLTAAESLLKSRLRALTSAAARER
jgi:hypothetical protein